MNGEQEGGKDRPPTSQLCEIVLPWPGNPLLGLSDCCSQDSSRVYSEAAVNKCFSTKTHINKPSTNTLSLPTIVHCQMACELWKVTHSQQHSRVTLPIPVQLHFANWNQFRPPQGKSELTQGQRLSFTCRAMAVLTTERKYLQPLEI